MFLIDLLEYKTGMRYVSEEILKLSDDCRLLLVGFGATNPDAIAKLEALWAKKSSNKNWRIGRSEEDTLAIKAEEFGGAITLVDLDNSTVLADIYASVPVGLAFDDKREQLYVSSEFNVRCFRKGMFIKELNNNLFNCVQIIKQSRYSDSLYVVCTGVDAIVQINPNFPEKKLFTWLATENGYPFDADGNKRIINPDKSYQFLDVGGTRRHTTHVNCVEELDKDTLLATLFHQGELIKINKKTLETTVVINGLRSPHGIHKIKDGYIVSNTRGNNVLLLDKDLNVTKTIEHNDFNWVHDAIQIGKQLFVANTNGGEIKIYNEDLIEIKNLKHNAKQRKISVLYCITGRQAKIAFCK
jgi:hypothetical protein